MPSGFLDWVAAIVVVVAVLFTSGVVVWIFSVIAGWWTISIIATYGLLVWSLFRFAKFFFRRKRL